MEGLRILDVGCNAGIFCVRASLEGAEEVVGIESDDWKKGERFWEQAQFVKSHFEEMHGRKLNIKYIKGRMEDVLLTDLGWFDYVLAIAAIYYSNTPNKTVKAISKLTDNVIVRIRDKNRIERFEALFPKHGFTLIKSLQEKWWEKLGRRTDDFWLFHYAK